MEINICRDFGREGFEGEIAIGKYNDLCDLQNQLEYFRNKKLTNNEIILLLKMIIKGQVFIINFRRI